MIRVDFTNVKEEYEPLTVSAILPRLRNVSKQAGGEYRAACPLCEISNRDGHHLYVTEKDGYLELYCHKCKGPQRDILAALDEDLPMMPTYVETRKQDTDKKLIENITYIYRNIDGSVAYKKTRKKWDDGSKKFSFQNPSGGYTKPDGSICIYGLDILAKTDRAERIYIVEGEKCAEAMREHGFTAICSSNGANGAKITDAEKNLLSEFFDKVVIPDNDDAGQKYIALWDGVKVLPVKDIWPDCPDKGDIADYFAAGLPASAIRNYNYCVPAMPMLVGKFKVNNDGIYAKKNADDTAFTITVANHAMIPNRRFRDVWTGQEKYEVAYFRDNIWKYVNIPADDLLNGRLLQKYAINGLMITSSNARMLAEFFVAAIAVMEGYTNTSSRMGWYQDSFIPWTGDIKLDNYGGTNEELMRGVKPLGRLEKWVEAVKPVWQANPAVCMYMAAGAAAPIVGRLNKDSFVVELYGRTGLGKTKALEIVASMFGLPAKNGLVFVMNSTTNYMTTTLNALKNVPMCIDENEARVNSAEYQMARSPEAAWLYEVTGNKARQKLKSTGEAMEAMTWSNTILITGEYPMTSERTPEGAKNRIIEIELDDYMTDSFADISKAIHLNYGRVAPQLARMIANEPDLHQQIEDRYQLIKGLNRAVTPKMANNGACCMLAYEYLERILGPGALDNETLISYLKTDTDVDQVSLVYEYLLEYLAKKDSNLREAYDYITPAGGRKSDHYENTGETIGMKHNGYYLVNKAAVDKALIDEFGKPMKFYQKEMARRHMISVYTNKGKTHYAAKQSIGAGNVCICYKINC